MRRWRIPGLALSLLLPAALAVAASKPAKPADGGWPDTREGVLARGWVEAFSAGDSAMRAFVTRNLARESLEKKGMDERMATYRASKERFGKLTLASVVKAIPGELTVSLFDADLKPIEFIFAVQTERPFKLISVSRKETGHGFDFHHGGSR